MGANGLLGRYNVNYDAKIGSIVKGAGDEGLLCCSEAVNGFVSTILSTRFGSGKS